jgi:hypothetical protein
MAGRAFSQIRRRQAALAGVVAALADHTAPAPPSTG